MYYSYRVYRGIIVIGFSHNHPQAPSCLMSVRWNSCLKFQYLSFRIVLN